MKLRKLRELYDTEETEAQRSKVICLRSHSYQVTQTGFSLGLADSRASKRGGGL